MSNDRWDLEDGDDGGLDHEPGDVRLNALLRSVPKPPRVVLKPVEPPPEIALATFDAGPYAGRSPFDIGELRDGRKIRDGVPDKYLERIVAVSDGGFAKAAPANMDPTLYAACVSALAFRRGGREVTVSQTNGQPAFNPWAPPTQAPAMPPYQPGPIPGWQQSQGGWPQQVPSQAPRFVQPQAVRMPCGHLSSDVAAGQGGRPVCGGCARLEALQVALAPLVGDKLAEAMQAVREWEFQLRSDLNV